MSLYFIVPATQKKFFTMKSLQSFRPGIGMKLVSHLRRIMSSSSSSFSNRSGLVSRSKEGSKRSLRKGLIGSESNDAVGRGIEKSSSSQGKKSFRSTEINAMLRQVQVQQSTLITDFGGDNNDDFDDEDDTSYDGKTLTNDGDTDDNDGGYYNDNENDKDSKHPKYLLPPYKKVLIMGDLGMWSNRALKTCRKVGVKTVALFSEYDTELLFASQADENLYIGDVLRSRLNPTPNPVSTIFANSMDRIAFGEIVDRAKRMFSIDAVLPSPAFLSHLATHSDKQFLSSCSVPIVGIPGRLEKIKDVPSIKKAARQCGFIVLKGCDAIIKNCDHALLAASELGFPVALKSRSNSNKLMFFAKDSSDLNLKYQMYSKLLMEKSLDPLDIYIEKYIPGAKTLEIQVLCDNDGDVAVFPERFCSARVDGFKYVEETPSSSMTAKVRKGISEQVAKFCKFVDFNATGTVKMVMDSKGVYHFVNFKLDSDFESSEMLTNVDVMEQLMWMSKGKRLPETLSDQLVVPSKGTLIASRILADSDDDKNQDKSNGKNRLQNKEGKPMSLTSYSEPLVRERNDDRMLFVDSAVFACTRVASPPAYFGVNRERHMISTIFSKAKHRMGAIKLMEDAIDEYVIRGLDSNILALRSIYRTKSFREDGALNIQDNDQKNVIGVSLTPVDTLEVIAIASLMHQNVLDLSYSGDRYKYALKINLPFQFVARMHSSVDKSKSDDYFKVEILRTIEDCNVHITPVTVKGQMRTESVAVTSFDWQVGGNLCKAAVSLSHESPTSPTTPSLAAATSTTSSDRSLQLENISISEGYSVIFKGCKSSIAIMSPLEFQMLSLIKKK